MAFRIDKRDMMFMLKEVLDMSKIFELEEFKDFTMEDCEMVVEQAVRFAIEKMAPTNKVSDRVGAKYDPVTKSVKMPEEFHKLYKEMCENGWHAPSAPAEFGGQGLPGLIGIAIGEAFVAANMAYMMTPGLTRSAAHVIEKYGTEEQIKTYVEKMISGEWAGTMCLTEPGAGSAVGDCKTTAKKTADGKFIITGTKIFISSGDQDLTENIVHLVLARTEGAPAGIKGISLFLVPKRKVNADGSVGETNDMYCGGIEEKLGIHGSPTCTLNFGDEGTCEGTLIGEEFEGIKYMFLMMNEARIGVGLQSLTQASCAYNEALDYARDRVQGVDILAMKDPNAPRIPIIQHPDVRRMLMIMKAHVEAARGLIYKLAFHTDFIMFSKDKAEKEKHFAILELLTPIVKAYISDTAFEATVLGVQVLGGYGYCAEYPLEQYMRDVKICSIYEGTNGIQSLDLLGRKVPAKGGMVLMSYMMELNKFMTDNKSNEAIGKSVAMLEQCRDKIVAIVSKLPKMGKADPIYPVLNATPFLRAFGEMVSGYILLEQASIADKKLNAIYSEKGADSDEKKEALLNDSSEAAFYFNKIQTANFFCANMLPGILSMEFAFNTGDRSALIAKL